MGHYIKEYLKAHKNCLFIFEVPTLRQLAEDLDFGQTLYMENVWPLINYAKVCGFDKVNMEHLHQTVGAHFRIGVKMLYYMNYTLMHSYRALFELPYTAKPNAQRIKCQNNVDEYFKKYGLLKEKTVILAPNAQSFSLIQRDFWELLAKKLYTKGFSVCTNVASKDEEVIPGTIPVFIKLNDIQEFAEEAGYFIALRSGLCDILCNCSCKKIVLYHFILDIDTDCIQYLS